MSILRLSKDYLMHSIVRIFLIISTKIDLDYKAKVRDTLFVPQPRRFSLKIKIAILSVLLAGLGVGLGLSQPWSSSPKTYTVKLIVTKRIKTYSDFGSILYMKVVSSDEKLSPDATNIYPYPDFRNIGDKIVIFFADSSFSGTTYGTKFLLTAQQKAKMRGARVGTVIVLTYHRLPTPSDKRDPFKTGEVKIYRAGDPQCPRRFASVLTYGSVVFLGCMEVKPGPVITWRTEKARVAKHVSIETQNA